MNEITMIEQASLSPAPAPRRRQHARPRLRRALTGLAAITAVTAGAFVVTSVLGGLSGPGPAAFAFETVSNDTIAIRVVDSEVAVKKMNQQLHDQGLTNVTVHALPVTPQLVGFWAGFGGSDGLSPAILDMPGQNLGYTGTIQVPTRFDGKLDLYVGRPPKPGEYADGGDINALAPAGILHCLRLSGADPDVAAARLSAAGYIPHWVKGTLHDGGPTVQKVPVEPKPGSRVVYATVPAGLFVNWPADSTDVYLRTAIPGSPEYQTYIWRGYPVDTKTPGLPDFSDCPFP
jgi:hypothetical protein